MFSPSAVLYFEFELLSFKPQLPDGVQRRIAAEDRASEAERTPEREQDDSYEEN